MPDVPSSVNYKGNNAFLAKVYNASTAEESRALYNEWATSYDKDLADEDYASPDLAVNAINRHFDPASTKGEEISVLDAGCGTGLVALSLAKSDLGRNHKLVIDGIDISEGMLGVAAKTGLYRKLEPADLSKPIALEDGTYDVVACVGTLTKAHVGPHVFPEFIRLARKGGLVVATVLNDIWVDLGYEKEVKALAKDGKVDVVGTEEFGIRKGQEKGGRMVVLKKR